jgi:hypothetical protein
MTDVKVCAAVSAKTNALSQIYAQGYLRARLMEELISLVAMAVPGRTSSCILFHSSVEIADHMSWDMSRRAVEAARVRETNAKEGENSPPEQGSRLQG